MSSWLKKERKTKQESRACCHRRLSFWDKMFPSVFRLLWQLAQKKSVSGAISISLPDSNPQEMNSWDSAPPPAALLPRSSISRSRCCKRLPSQQRVLCNQEKQESLHAGFVKGNWERQLYFSEASWSMDLGVERKGTLKPERMTWELGQRCFFAPLVAFSRWLNSSEARVLTIQTVATAPSLWNCKSLSAKERGGDIFLRFG